MDPRTRLDDDDKREIPPFVQKVLAVDVELTKKFVSFCLNFVPIRSLRTHCKFLEVGLKLSSVHHYFWHIGILTPKIYIYTKRHHLNFETVFLPWNFMAGGYTCGVLVLR